MSAAPWGGTGQIDAVHSDSKYTTAPYVRLGRGRVSPKKAGNGNAGCRRSSRSTPHSGTPSRGYAAGAAVEDACDAAPSAEMPISLLASVMPRYSLRTASADTHWSRAASYSSRWDAVVEA